ncbi:MAG: hypothetical protein F6K39_26095 [Okeania sp. SIO3B3]|nr:hypothetical protein [Okeania sp. SIO3B3]
MDTDANDGAELVCDSCVLNFETGANISEDNSYTFANGGSVSITGTVTDDLGNIIASGELVNGSFTEDVSVITNDFAAVFAGLGVNDMNSDLSSFFGIETTEFTFAQTAIAMEEVEVENNGGFSGVVTNVDFDSTAKKVPEPTVLFGLGVVVMKQIRENVFPTDKLLPTISLETGLRDFFEKNAIYAIVL